MLLDTIRDVLKQDPPADEILVVDQTPQHEPATSEALQTWHDSGKIRWIHHSPPSLPGARNRALLEATSDLLLFLDDDVILCPGFIGIHRAQYADSEVVMVAGQVLDKDGKVYSGKPRNYEESFPRNFTQRCWIIQLFGGNHSVRKSVALELGGYDEQFAKSAIREETDLAFRMFSKLGKKVLFEPTASLIHLAASSGGCRNWGVLTDLFAYHYTAGDYYFALRNLPWYRLPFYMARCALRCVFSHANRRKPWRIPIVAGRECIAVGYAFHMFCNGRKLLRFLRIET